MILPSTIYQRQVSSQGASCSFRSVNPHPRHALRRPRHCTRLRSLGRRRSKGIVILAGRNYYEILGIPKDADSKSVKKAFKKMALKCHPDVNPEPNAKEQFMECKAAYQTLVDSKLRKQYDATLDGSFKGSDWNPFGFKGASQQRRQQRQEEEFYGFSQFFEDLEQGLSQGVAKIQGMLRDLDKEFQERQQARTDQPKSLWQELYDVGEEFVEFLEQEVAALGTRGKAGKGNSEQAQRNTQEGEDSGQVQAQLSAEEQAKREKKEAEESVRRAEMEVEEMLKELKTRIRPK